MRRPVLLSFFFLLLWALPQGAWAAENELETILINGVTYNILRTSEDWDAFISLVSKAGGKSDVNVIMDGDFTTAYVASLDAAPYRGIFDGNGHTLNLNIDCGTNSYGAPFPSVNQATFKNLTVTGSVKGGMHSSGLIGHVYGSSPSVTIEKVRMSAAVTISETHVGGFIGHAGDAKVVITDCRFDGTLTASKSNAYGGAFCGWSHNGSWTMHRLYEDGTYNGIAHAGFSYWYDNAGNKSTHAWGTNASSTSCLSAHNWSEMANADCKSVTNQNSVVTTMNKEKAGSWQLADGKAVPVADTYEKREGINVEFYDIIPGVENGDEGTLKIPVSSDKVIKWIESSYIGEDGNVNNLGGRNVLPANSYFGYVKLPASEAHRQLTVTVKLMIGQVTKTYEAKKDVVLHNPRLLEASPSPTKGGKQESNSTSEGGESKITDAGAMMLKWSTKDMEFTDILESDPFVVQRSMTGKVEDFEDIATVPFDTKESAYEYKDQQFIKDLTPELIDKELGIPLVRYRVFRSSSRQLWGMLKNPTVAYVQPQLATLFLLEPKDAKASWSDETEHKVKLTWDYQPTDNSHNYVWDSRAAMLLEVKCFRRDGSLADSTVTKLTDEQMAARQMELQLTHSCVTYEMRLIVDGGESPIGKGTGEIFTVLRSSNDYVAYRESYNTNKLTSRQNAIMVADFTVPKNSAMLGSDPERPFTHNLNGNGHTLTYENVWAGSWRALIQHAADGAVITHLKAAGRLYHDCQYAASLVAHVIRGNVFVENCYSAMTLDPVENYMVNSQTGGLVGLVSGGSLRISNSQYAGLFKGGGRWSGMVGWREDDSFTMISNSYYSGQIDMKNQGNATFIFGNLGTNNWWNIVEDCSYINKLGILQGKQSYTTPDNGCWENDMPRMVQKSFVTAVSGSSAAVTLPDKKFYFENLGRISRTSLVVQTQQSSVVLSWKNEGEEPVDYYEVWRCDTLTKDTICLISQLTDMVYEDRTVSPVHGYRYFVRGVNSCEGTKYEDTEWRSGHCINTGMVEGYLRFADGTGIPGYPINITSADNSIQEVAYTDETGYFRKEGLPYFNGTETTYSAMPSINGYSKGAIPVTFLTEPGGNTVSGVVFTVEESVRFSGFVQYDGTSIPVQGVTFIVDGRQLHNSAGKVVTDHEGKFTFHLLKDAPHSIQAVKDGHTFYQKGYYHEDNDTTRTQYNFSVDKAGIYFYDQTRVRLIGRVAGGKDQAAIPLGNSLSRNNLGDDLQIVLTLEGDKSSRLVWDIQDTKKKERDEVFHHKAHDTKHDYQTQVHTTLNRKVVMPDPYTGEYELLLPPVKWKIQQITARGYTTLFQDGQTGDVIDLTDSLTEHHDEYVGKWKSATDKTITNVVVNYHAQYSRIYHSPVLIDYRQIGYDTFDYFGDRYYNARNLAGENEQVPLCYPVTKKQKDASGKERETVETVYSFGYPVFDIERSYPIKISAVEKYYFNNNTKSDTVDVVRLSGGEVTIHNGFESSTHREVVKLDSVGEALYSLKAKQVPYLLSGKDALRTLTMTLAMDGTHYEAKPLQAYILNIYSMAGAKDLLSFTKPQLIDILRDPPGGGSSAKLSKGSTLKYTYTLDWSYKGGFELHWQLGPQQSMFTGLSVGVGTAALSGFIQGGTTGYPIDIGIVFSGKGKKGWSYTMTTTEDISTSSDKTMVGADGDVYIGAVTNVVMKPAVAIRALPYDMYKTLKGQMAAGKLVVIAKGVNAKGDSLFLVRDEVAAYGPKTVSTFIHSQKYIVDQILPSLASHCAAQLFFGTEDEARTKARQTGQPVYLSLLQPNQEGFGLLNNTKIDGTGDYIYNSTAHRDSRAQSYLIVLPDDTKDEKVDSIKVFSESMLEWMKLIAQNESEKLAATEKVKNFDIDGGTGMSYSESFKSEVSISEQFKSPFESSASLQILGSLAKIITKLVGKGLGTKGGTKIEASPTADEDNRAGLTFETTWGFMSTQFNFVPVIEFNIDRTNGASKAVERKESFTISMDKRSHLDFDVYRVSSKVSDVAPDNNGFHDVFVNRNYDDVTKQTLSEVEQLDNSLITLDVNSNDLKSYKGFVYRTRGGATCRPYEGERKTQYYNEGTVLDERTKKIENPVIKMDKQSISGVPSDEPARFKLYLANESEVPEATYPFYDLYMVETSNPKGAKIMMDGIPLSGNPRTVMVNVGEVTEKTIEVYAGEDFDYEKLKLRIQSQGDAKTFQEVEFDVHYLQAAGSVAITSPGDKWIMNCDAQYEDGKGWYLPVVISGFNKNQHNFDHIEFQYKESTRGDDYWTNLCGYYNDSTIYAAASGTKAMIPENGNIVTRFFGDGQVMEKAYDLRAVLFCRNGNGFLTSASKVLSGVKDTRRPQLFGTPEPKDGILGAGDNVVFNFSEGIEYNYLQATTNFEVKGETNESSIQEAPSLQFSGKGFAQSEARRNFADKSVTIEVMIKPDDVDEDMPIFSHGRDGKHLQLWLTKRKTLRAVVDDKVLESDTVINTTGFQRVALVLDNEQKKLFLYSKNKDAVMDSVSYSGYGPVIFGSTQQTDISLRSYYKGRMLQGRVWNRAMDINLLNTYGNQLLTGYEMGLTDYYPMNEGRGSYATDLAQGAHLLLNGASWAQPRGMSLRLDKNEQRDVKGLEMKPQFLQRSSEQDYTLMFWFKTGDDSGNGTLLSNGAGRANDVDAANKFFIGFEDETLKYRSNGREYVLGDTYCDNEWHHYAMTVSRSHQVASIYVDNDMKAQFATDSLGGMTGRFYLGNMVWKEAGDHNDVVRQQNALTGHLDGIALFEQALPMSLIKRYTSKALGGAEKGLITYVGFDRQERQKNGDITLQPFVLNKKVLYDLDGNATDQHDTVFVDSAKEITERVDRNTGAPMQAYEELRNLNFSYVGRDHQLLVNIDELDSRINKRTVYVTVSDIPDLNGNYTASPATTAVFVDRNPLRWAQKTYKTLVFQNNESLDNAFDINIVNNSGAAHTFKVEKLPKWLNVNTLTDVIDPKSEQTLTFSIGGDINAGTYDDIIYLTDENGLYEPLALNITVEAEQPAWYVDENMKQFSMNIVARVKIDDDIVTDSRDMVGVFDSEGRCMGVGNVNYNAATSESLVFLTVCDSMTIKRKLGFKLWHYETGKTIVLTPSQQVEFMPETLVGSTSNPIVLRGGDLYIQTIRLWSGWNWVSLNVLNNSYYLAKDFLKWFTWHEGDMLTDETNNISLLYQDGQWIANKGSKELDKLQLTISQSYRVKVGNSVTIELTGNVVKTKDDRTINVKKGWNSIGYTPLVNLPISTALSDYLEEAEDGDVVKSKTSFAMFTKGANGSREWKGNLKYLKPGEGYMLYRQREGTAHFTYPFYDANVTFFEESGSNAAPMMAEDFANNMVMTAVAEGVELQEGDKLVAYADGLAVGEASLDSSEGGKLLPIGEAGRSLFYLTIAGDQKAPLSFAIERDGDIIATTSEIMTYQTDAVSGTPTEPTKISFVRNDELPQQGWYTVQGIKLQGAPTQRGVYLYNGKKVKK